MIILGSQSPRRREIINLFSLPHQSVSPNFDEDSIPFEGDPIDYACQIAKGKAESLISDYGSYPILTADTVVYKDGAVYGKPKDEQHAFEMLQTLSGEWHTVISSLALYHDNVCKTTSESTEVLFNPLTEDQIRRYHQSIQWQDKAGAYAIQMGGGIVVRKIKGCYYNTMGLPINTLRELLKTIGIDLWDYLN